MTRQTAILLPQSAKGLLGDREDRQKLNRLREAKIEPQSGGIFKAPFPIHKMLRNETKKEKMFHVKQFGKRKITYRYKASEISYKQIAEAVYKTLNEKEEERKGKTA